MRTALLIILTVATYFFSVFFLPQLQLDSYGEFFITVLSVLLLFGETKTALLGAMIGGTLTDTMTAQAFGTHLLASLGALLLTMWVAKTRVTNRSFIAYCFLVLTSLLTYLVLLIGLARVMHVLNPQSIYPLVQSDLLSSIIGSLVRSGIAAISIYLVIRATGKSYSTLTQHSF